jgi:hypothetical protein
MYIFCPGQARAHFSKKVEKFLVVSIRRIHNQFSILRIDCAKNGFPFALALRLADSRLSLPTNTKR